MLSKINMVRSVFFGHRTSSLIRFCSVRFTSNITDTNTITPNSTHVAGPPEVCLHLLKLNHREQRIASLLKQHDFDSRQISLIIRDFRENNVIYEIDPKIITEAFLFWNENLVPPKKHSLVSYTPGEEYTLQDILSRECPRLLLVDPEHMAKRVKALKTIGFLSGKNDLWTCFAYASRAYFLQDWRDFCQKYFYIQHRVLEFLIDKKKDPFPTPHPLVKACKVFEMSYTNIKARFEFLIKTGFKTPAAALRATGQPLSLDLDLIFLSDMDQFLKKYAPGVSEEEFNVFEKMIEENPDDEDKILIEICQLNDISTSANYGIADPFLGKEESKKLDKIKYMKKKAAADKVKKGWLRPGQGRIKNTALEEEDTDSDEERDSNDKNKEKLASHLTRL